MIINLPSSNGIFFRLSRLLDQAGLSGPHDRLWQKGFPSPHISYFSPHNLPALVERNSDLQQRDSFRLPSLSRDGLKARIQSSHPGTIGLVMFAGVWGLSFLLPWLPADIHVAVFKK